MPKPPLLLVVLAPVFLVTAGCDFLPARPAPDVQEITQNIDDEIQRANEAMERRTSGDATVNGPSRTWLNARWEELSAGGASTMGQGQAAVIEFAGEDRVADTSGLPLDGVTHYRARANAEGLLELQFLNVNGQLVKEGLVRFVSEDRLEMRIEGDRVRLFYRQVGY